MSDPLTSEEERQYTAIIDDILATSDLQTISAKAIRKGVQAQVDADVNAKKQAVTALIMRRFDVFNAASTPTDVVQTTEVAPPTSTSNTNGAHAQKPVKAETNGSSKKRSSPTSDDDDDEDLSSPATSPPPTKRTKIEKSQQESDEQYAKRLQAELNRVQGRSTRGGGSTTKRKPVAKTQRKKKSKARVGSDEDSDVEGGEKKEVKRTGGFHKPMALSPQLSALLNETQLSRPQTVKKIWEYIKSKNLQDQSDKRQIICDDAMRSVFKSDKVHMFTMNKVINTHLYNLDEITTQPAVV